jgi:hypothetical protein
MNSSNFNSAFLLVSLVVFLAGIGYIWTFSSLFGNEVFTSPQQNANDISFGPEHFGSYLSCAENLSCTDSLVCCYYSVPDAKLPFLRESRLGCLIPEDCANVGIIVG